MYGVHVQEHSSSCSFQVFIVIVIIVVVIVVVAVILVVVVVDVIVVVVIFVEGAFSSCTIRQDIPCLQIKNIGKFGYCLNKQANS